MTLESREYHDNLRHLAEPQAPSERSKAVSVSLQDYEALFLKTALREQAYHAEDDTERDLSIAYADYIDHVVRDIGQSHVSLYVHTVDARRTLLSATADVDSWMDTVPENMVTQINAKVHTDSSTVVNEEEPEVVEIDGELTVAWDEDEAQESYATMQIEEAESEHLAEIEEEANARGINNRRTPRINPRYRE